MSGSPKRADDDQPLQGRRREGMGDAAQPLQEHGDAPPDELAREVHHSATGAERGYGELPDPSRECE